MDGHSKIKQNFIIDRKTVETRTESVPKWQDIVIPGNFICTNKNRSTSITHWPSLIVN